MGDKKHVLYVALDESNHGLFPEVCVAIFSTIPEDSHNHEFFCKGDSKLLCQLPSENRDYRFLFLDKAQVKTGGNNLSLAAPSLILPYLRQHTGGFDTINLFFDGRLDIEERNSIEQCLEHFATTIHARGFIKRWRPGCECSKSYIQPYLLGIADAKAHSLFEEYHLSSPNPELRKLKHDKLVELLQ